MKRDRQGQERLLVLIGYGIRNAVQVLDVLARSSDGLVTHGVDQTVL